MNKHQAEKIVKEYGGAIAKVSNDTDVFRKRSNLPCSKAKIRYAFYILINTVVKEQGHLSEDIGQSLVTIYSMLDSFIQDEDADRLNKIPDMLKDKQFDRKKPKSKKQIEEYFSLVPNALRNSSYFDEINEYIRECYKEKGLH